MQKLPVIAGSLFFYIRGENHATARTITPKITVAGCIQEIYPMIDTCTAIHTKASSAVSIEMSLALFQPAKLAIDAVRKDPPITISKKRLGMKYESNGLPSSHSRGTPSAPASP